MSDEYICSVCGHRAGDHAVANRCINDCDCKDDPYLEQLSALQEKLAIAVEAMNKTYKELISTTGVYSRVRTVDIIEEALARLEEK